MINNKIKIIHTPVRFYPYMGGVEYSTYQLCRELIRLGCEIEVICARTLTNEPDYIDGIFIKRLKSFFKITNTNITLTLPFEILRSKFDIVHTHMPTPWTADISILIGKLMKRKTIITIHNDMDKTGFLSKIVTEIYLHTLFLLSLYMVDRIIIINEEWEKSFSNTNYILRRFKNKISISANGVNSELFIPTGIVREKNTILFVSILDKHHMFKGLDYLLEAVGIIKLTIPDIKLIVIGEGELTKKYKNLSKELEISKNVIFLGKKNQKELVPYYNKASIFVLPSTQIEGFGNVLIEAMACETPVVATSIVGVANDIVKYKCGLIVKSKDPTELAGAIMKLFADMVLSRSMGENGRDLVKNKYNWIKIAEQNRSIYKELINK